MTTRNSSNQSSLPTFLLYSPALSDAIYNLVNNPGGGDAVREAANDLLGRMPDIDELESEGSGTSTGRPGHDRHRAVGDGAGVTKLLRALTALGEGGSDDHRSSLREAWRGYEEARRERAVRAAYAVTTELEDFKDLNEDEVNPESAVAAAKQILKRLSAFRDGRSGTDSQLFVQFVNTRWSDFQRNEFLLVLDNFKLICDSAGDYWNDTALRIGRLRNPADDFDSNVLPSVALPVLANYVGLDSQGAPHALEFENGGKGLEM